MTTKLWSSWLDCNDLVDLVLNPSKDLYLILSLRFYLMQSYKLASFRQSLNPFTTVHSRHFMDVWVKDFKLIYRFWNLLLYVSSNIFVDKKVNTFLLTATWLDIIDYFVAPVALLCVCMTLCSKLDWSGAKFGPYIWRSSTSSSGTFIWTSTVSPFLLCLIDSYSSFSLATSYYSFWCALWILMRV